MYTKTYRLALVISVFFLTGANASDNHTIRVLSLQSQGGKSFVPALVLKNLEKILGGSIADRFDLIVADGGAGLVAAALGSKQSTYDILEALSNHGKGVFKQNSKTKLRAFFGGNKYDSGSYEKYLKSQFKDQTLSDLEIPVAILAYDEEGREVVTFSGKHQNSQISNETLTSILRATTTSKGSFKAVEMDNGTGQSMIFKNNEGVKKDVVLHAFEEAKRQYPSSQKVIFVNIEDSTAQTSKAAERFIKADPNTQLHNIAIRLKKAVAPDDVSAEALNSMRYSVEDYFQTHRNQLRLLVKELMTDRDSQGEVIKAMLKPRVALSDPNLEDCYPEEMQCAF